MRVLILALAFLSLSVEAREVLTSVRTYYVSPSGSDSNDCLSSSSPCGTIQGALDKVRSVDLGAYGAIVQLASGTYTAGATVWSPWVGGNPLNGPSGFGSAVLIRGDWANPSGTVISVTNGSCIRASYGGGVNVEGIKCVVNGSGNGLYASAFGFIVISQAVDFGASAGDHMLANQNGKIMVTHNYFVSGGGVSHFRAFGGGSIEANGVTVFVSNSPSFSQAFAWASTLGLISATGNNYTANTTGKQYDISYNAVVESAGFPGTVAGTVSSGGQLK